MNSVRADTIEIIQGLRTQKAHLLNNQESLRVELARNVSTLREIDITLAEAEELLAELG